MNPIYLKLPLVGEIYVEYPCITRGHRFVDVAPHRGGLELWVGKLHVTADGNPLAAVAAAGLTSGIALFLYELMGTPQITLAACVSGSGACL